MKIISKFKDYYDCGMKYGVDASCVYMREIIEYPLGCVPVVTEVTDIVTKMLDGDKVRLWWHRYDFDFRADRVTVEGAIVVIFCGQIYPCLEVVTCFSGELGDAKTTYCYASEQVTTIFREQLTKTEQKSFFEPNKRRGSWSERFEEFFDATGMGSSKLIDFHHRSEVPIAMLHLGNNNNVNRLTCNPVLKDVQFFRIIDNITAYQELSMFIGGVLGGNSPKTIEISNDIKIAKHGFDKWSFRKEPGKKRKL